MPNYSYECQDCLYVFDVKASIEEMEKGYFPCEKCGSKNTKRLFDGFGYCRVNGSGETNRSSCSTCAGGSCSTCNH